MSSSLRPVRRNEPRKNQWPLFPPTRRRHRLGCSRDLPLKSFQDKHHKLACPGINFLRRTASRPCHIQGADFMTHQPLHNRLRLFLRRILSRQQSGAIRCGKMLNLQGFSMGLSRICRQAGTAGDLIQHQNQRPVGVSHVPFGPNGIRTGRRFLQWIMVGNSTILRPSAAWTPSADLQAMLQSGIERRSIHASLSARENSYGNCIGLTGRN